MSTQHACTDKKNEIFTYLLFLTGFFLLIEISLFVQCNKAYLSSFRFVSSNLHIPISILPDILIFIGIQFGLHFAYCVLVWIITSFTSYLFSFAPKQKISLAISFWLLGIVSILLANQYFFPNSKFADLMVTIIPSNMILPLLFIGITLFTTNVLLAFVGLIKYIYTLAFKKKNRFSDHLKWPGIILALMSISLISLVMFQAHKKVILNDVATNERPNIFLIGVDALRPDFLSYFGADHETPFFADFLSHSTVFTQAVTPLARTFPSWSSILSGQYPRQIGIRSNLAAQQNLNLQNTLSAILKNNGYETIFATDETRFSNIDKNFGFDKVLTPPMGLNDFLLGTFNDFPMSNLLVNTPLGHWLFPHSYANRAAFVTYEPNSFLTLIEKGLAENRIKPVFMSVHFCLTHFPYGWAGFSTEGKTALERYQASIQRVDQQVKDLLDLLAQKQLLNHAIVVLLSDHGEALELSGDRLTENDLFISKQKTIPKFYPPSLDDEAINKSAGHGTDVLGLTQYHSLLAFKLYGLSHQEIGDRTQIVSLLDIKPTILSFLNLPSPLSSGHSLAEVIKDQKKSLPMRHIFIESDFSPEAIRTVYPETRKVLLVGIHLFEIDPVTTRLIVKNSMESMIIKSKQYADIYGEWMLALYPQNDQFRMPILINLASGKWTNDLQSDFALQSPAKNMLAALKTFYGAEI